MYLDSAYIAKFYVNEVDASAVRAIITQATRICSSSWALIEVPCVFHRHVREGMLTPDQGRELTDLFRQHVEDDVWNLIPLTDGLLRRTTKLIRGMPGHVPLRAGDAIHLATALEAHEEEVWTNDPHLLAAAGHCGLVGKSVFLPNPSKF